MSYRFELREQVGPAFARIATEQIDRVLRDLTAPEDRDLAVHEGRKSLKRLRALFRLVRPGIGGQTFKAENARFRDIAALFSADRDRHVLASVAGQRAAAMGPRYRKAFGAIKKALAGQAKVAASNQQEAVSRLKAARELVAELPLPESFQTLQDGLAESYRRGRRQLRSAYADPNDEAFHDLRKSVQQHWRHMQVLQRAWPDLFVARLEAARRLSQILGDDHDLAVFVARLKTMPRSALSAADRRAIERHCRVEQDRLRTLAHPLCQQLYAERAGEFAKRIAAIWLAATRLAEIEASFATKPAAKATKSKAHRDDARLAAKPASRRGNSAQAAKPAP
ncbi:MAG: CHAD domain-containing protein [Hyphomicrobiaceae bacterium]|nr:CHAD domain-containing protein [Hyphomicrobiaceae bacterium]